MGRVSRDHLYSRGGGVGSGGWRNGDEYTSRRGGFVSKQVVKWRLMLLVPPSFYNNTHRKILLH